MKKVVFILILFASGAFALDYDTLQASKDELIEAIQGATNIYSHVENIIPDVGLLIYFTATISDSGDDEDVIELVLGVLGAMGHTLEGLEAHEWLIVQFRTSRPPFDDVFTYTIKLREGDGRTEVWRDGDRLY